MYTMSLFLLQLKPVRSFENFGNRSFMGAGTSSLNFQASGSAAGAGVIVPPHFPRSGIEISPPVTGIHSPLNPFQSPPMFESQHGPLAYSTPKGDTNAFTPSPEDTFTSLAQLPSGKRSNLPSTSSSVLTSTATMLPMAPPVRPSRAAKV